MVHDNATPERQRSLLGAPCVTSLPCETSTPQSPSSWLSPSSPSKRSPKVLVVKPVQMGRSPSKTDSIDRILPRAGARPHAARVLANNPALVELDLNGMEKWEAQARVSEQEVSLYSAEARKMYPAYLLMEVFGRGFALTSRTPLPGRSPDDRATLFVTEDVLLKVFQDESEQPAHNLDPACCDSLLFSD